MKMIFKEFEDEGGCKDGVSIPKISRLMKNFKDRWWSLSWKVSRPTYVQKIWWKCIKNQVDHSQFQVEDISQILKRMKLSNQNGADLFQVKEDDCN